MHGKTGPLEKESGMSLCNLYIFRLPEFGRVPVTFVRRNNVIDEDNSFRLIARTCLDFLSKAPMHRADHLTLRGISPIAPALQDCAIAKFQLEKLLMHPGRQTPLVRVLYSSNLTKNTVETYLRRIMQEHRASFVRKSLSLFALCGVLTASGLCVPPTPMIGSLLGLLTLRWCLRCIIFLNASYGIDTFNASYKEGLVSFEPSSCLKEAQESETLLRSTERPPTDVVENLFQVDIS
eukprot:TRINITY_DN21188_c0_g1_i8.p1 TRINITY_DN21188_c0_g1~~TRINITY_DN21188_c0_g1_i8.p1  ORF type:complete len:236 (-),score=15.15 TRINITY_DN21188_c0_g1_i8:547-1254(-)